jgi:membrane protein required for colicin V production
LSDFTVLDWVVVVIVTYSVVASVVRGFVREVLGLATLVAALLIAAWFHAPLGRVLAGFLRSENQALFASFVILFGATFLVGFVTIRLIRKLVKFASVEWVDRILGGAFGLVRGWLVAAVLFLALTSFGIGASAVRSSSLSHYFLPAVRLLATVTPFELKARYLIGYDDIRRWWNDQMGQPDESFSEPGADGETGEEAPAVSPEG